MSLLILNVSKSFQFLFCAFFILTLTTESPPVHPTTSHLAITVSSSDLYLFMLNTKLGTRSADKPKCPTAAEKQSLIGQIYFL